MLNEADAEAESGADRTLGDLLRQGAVLRGLVGPALVTVVNGTQLTDESFSVVYRAESGALGERIVFASDFSIGGDVEAGADSRLDFKVEGRKPAAEARRRQLAKADSGLGQDGFDPLRQNRVEMDNNGDHGPWGQTQ